MSKNNDNTVSPRLESFIDESSLKCKLVIEKVS